MAGTRITESNLTIRLDSDAAGQWCSVCNEVQAEYQPEMFIQTDTGYRFLCKLCAWDHAPWLVSLINMGHYSEWEAWGGKPPTPQMLHDMGLTVGDMLGDQAEKPIPDSRPNLVNQHTAMLAAYVSGGEDQPFAAIPADSPDWGRQVALTLENRRSETRYAICIPAKVSITGKSATTSSLATTRNVSDSGAYLLTDAKLEAGAQVLLEMSFPNGGTLLARGHIVRKDDTGVGVTFSKTEWRKR